MDLIQELYNVGTVYKDDVFYEGNGLSKFFEINDDNQREVKVDLEINVWTTELDTEEIDLDSQTRLDNMDELFVVLKSSSGGNLFPVMDLASFSDKKSTMKKFITGTQKAIKNMKLSCNNNTVNEDIKNIFSLLDKVDFEKLETILTENQMAMTPTKKNKGYFTFTYKGKFITSYLKDIYLDYINSAFLESLSNKSGIVANCFLTNERMITSAINTPFSSVNELAGNKQELEKINNISFAPKVAGLIDFGYKNLMEKNSFYWGGIQVAMIPVLLNGNSTTRYEITKALENTINKNKLDTVSHIESSLNTYIESFNEICITNNFFVLNSFLFYEKSNAKNDLLLQVDDVLPSYISKITELLSRPDINLKVAPSKGDKGKFYLTNLFKSNTDAFSLLLSSKTFSKKEFMCIVNNLIMNGGVGDGEKTQWENYFNVMYTNATGRQIEHIYRVSTFFNELEKIDFTIFKEYIVEEKKEKEIKVTKDEFIEEITIHENNIVFIGDNDILKSAFYLGFLSSMMINLQKASTNNNSTLASYLSFRQIRSYKDILSLSATITNIIQKINGYSYVGKKADAIQTIVLGLLSKIEKRRVNGDEVNICFAIGGETFKSFKKHKIEG